MYWNGNKNSKGGEVMKRIGFIGLGVMGNSMAGHLLAAGHPLFVYTRTKEKAESLLERGAVWVDTPGELTKLVDVIITMIGYPTDVEEVYLGENGILANGEANLVAIDMTTSSPSLAKKIYDAAKVKGISILDAPVSGGDIGAQTAKLSIMVGGDEQTFVSMKPLFECMGTQVVYQGLAGSGQHTKMANQIALAGAMIGVCEAIVYAEKAGLDPAVVLKSISSGAAGSWAMSNLASRMLAGDFAPGFYIKHYIKDMTIALAEAEKMGILTPGLRTVKQMYEALAKSGRENDGTQALYTYWDRS